MPGSSYKREVAAVSWYSAGPIELLPVTTWIF